MGKVPHTPEEIFEAFVADYRALFGEQLISIVLYGSGARGEYVRKRSDINFLVVLSEEGMKEIGKALPVVTKWRKRNVSPPLFMTPEYIASSLDSFPMEFLSLKQHHRVVFGEDPLQQVEIDRKLLRLQCEREVKGKLLHLREAYLATAGRRDLLAGLIRRSLTAFVPLFEALLVLKDMEVPRSRTEVIAKGVEAFGLDAAVFSQLLRVWSGEKLSRQTLDRLAQQFAWEVRRLALTVDAM
ncbi:MAG: nucleotidyltransferase domain-containing protein [bacterium]|jgi:predicted nucleotidyltransferase|nr:nucleotidyltransferase domain-containing protein [candidate division KSB1 bacterium]MDH7560239.1 nucleotidyltransferase domain-containing protein [bacterium]